MAADVSSGQSADEKKKELVTRDLLGGKGGEEKDLWEEKFEFLSRKPTCSANHVLHDLNYPPPPPPIPSYSNVCTLEKVKIALERAMRDPNPNPNPKSEGSAKRRAVEGEETDDRDCSGRMSGGSMMVTVCPGCFQYLLVPKVDPSCPRCDRHVAVAASGLGRKKGRIDLNCSTGLDN